MFSENEQISLRQTFRLFFFDFLGIATLVLPTALAGYGGVFGIWSILAGTVIGLLYIAYLQGCMKRIQGSWLDAVGKSPVFGAVLPLALAVCCITSAGYLSFVFGTLIRQSLIQEESYLLILALLVLLTGYAVKGGLECRARTYEVLFWFVVLPLLFMLALAVKNADVRAFSAEAGYTLQDAAKGIYMMLICFSSLFFVLLLPGKVAETKEGAVSVIRAVRRAFLWNVGILLVSYGILLVSFGERALAGMNFPIITLMQNVQFRGGFVKRLDALMLSVWFFTLFALISMNLYYARQCLGTFGRGEKRLQLWVILLLIFVIAVMIEYLNGVQKALESFFAYVQTPLLLVFPALGVCLGGGITKKKA